MIEIINLVVSCPTELERRFYLVAGLLECADREFVSIAEEIDKYKNTVLDELDKGDLDIELNTTSLIEYLTSKFRTSIESGILQSEFGPGNAGDKEIAEELKSFGISKLYELDKIIPKQYEDELIKHPSPMEGHNFSGLIRDIMMINDPKKYFKESWKKHWKFMFPDDMERLEKFNVDASYLQKYITIERL